MADLIEIREAVIASDGALNLYMKTADGRHVDVKLGEQAQVFILKALLGSTLDPLSPTSQRLRPIGLSRFRLNDDIGLSFLFGTELGMHFTLDRSLAAILNELLSTFDDPTTWRTSRLN